MRKPLWRFCSVQLYANAACREVTFKAGSFLLLANFAVQIALANETSNHSVRERIIGVEI